MQNDSMEKEFILSDTVCMIAITIAKTISPKWKVLIYVGYIKVKSRDKLKRLMHPVTFTIAKL